MLRYLFLFIQLREKRNGFCDSLSLSLYLSLSLIEMASIDDHKWYSPIKDFGILIFSHILSRTSKPDFGAAMWRATASIGVPAGMRTVPGGSCMPVGGWSMYTWPGCNTRERNLFFLDRTSLFIEQKEKMSGYQWKQWSFIGMSQNS